MSSITQLILVVCLAGLSFSFHLEESLESDNPGFTVSLRGKKLFQHSQNEPAVYVGQGQTTFACDRGNFDIDDYVTVRTPTSGPYSVLPGSCDEHVDVSLTLQDSSKLVLKFRQASADAIELIVDSQMMSVDRIWLRFPAEADDMVFGGGEQFSYLNLRGHKYPIWTREQGVGRNKSTLQTFYSDSLDAGAGGDYHTTYFPQATFIASSPPSSQVSYVHLNTSAYTVMDFTHGDFHELEVHHHGQAFNVLSGVKSSFLDMAEEIGNLVGKQAPLPDWVYNGTILGVQGGTTQVLSYLEQARSHDVKVTGLWIQDWTGRITTSFGRRLFWDWVWNPKQYPNLDTEIIRLKNEGIRMFAYITPNLNVKGTLYPEAEKGGYLVKNPKGETYLMDFGEFFCAFIDLTNPAAVTWYKGVIRKNLIDFGFSGWMADFSEYTPVEDAVFYNGQSPDILHNEFPYLWAKLNREVVEEAGKLGEILFWMRAGTAGTQRTSVIMWAGDQNVDFERSDGLPSTIPAALSMTMSGMGLTHFDIGGYTSLFGLTRTKEVLLRSAEMAVFTALMRTHEGNRPSENVQVYTDDETWNSFSRLTRIYTALGPYIQAVVQEHSTSGWGVQRPIFYHYDGDGMSFDTPYQYLLGADLLVAPVLEPSRTTWRVTLPGDDWIFLWDGTEVVGPTEMEVDAPIGKPPVFYRRQSKWADSIFSKLKDIV